MQKISDLENLLSKVDYIDGNLFWNNEHRFRGKKVGYQNKNGYIEIKYAFKKAILTHRLIFYKFKGFLPDLVDHIDRNTQNNRIENLRAADKSINSINREKQKNNTTGHKGVYLNSSGNYYICIKRSKILGKRLYKGCWANIDDAIKERDTLLKKYDI